MIEVKMLIVLDAYHETPSSKTDACLPALLLQLCPTLSHPWAVTCQVFLSMGLSRQEY